MVKPFQDFSAASLRWAGAIEEWLRPSAAWQVFFAILWKATFLTFLYATASLPHAAPPPPTDPMAGNIVHDATAAWRWLHTPVHHNAPGVLDAWGDHLGWPPSHLRPRPGL
jgi:hypothetical protein